MSEVARRKQCEKEQMHVWIMYGVCPGRLVHGNIEGFDMMCGVVQVILADEKICAKERYRKCTLKGWKARFERMQAKAMQILAAESVQA